ncbi:MAG: hypothetical protein U0M51_02180 [Eggerthellaceae bacterium]
MIVERIVAYGHGPLSPSYMCVHSTANPGATAANHASLWSRQPDYAVHLVSDWRECLHCVPYGALCWQVGNGNAFVEGIEVCEAENRADFEAGIEIAAQACAERLAARGWGVGRLITHDMARTMWGGTDHTDPTPYFSRWGYSFDQFKARVAEIMEGDIVREEDIERIANRVWEVGQGSATADRVYRCTSMLKAMCGIGAEDTSDPKAYADDVRAWTMGRWERMLRILKGMVGIPQEETGDGMIATPMHVSLSDEDVERVAKRVAEIMKEEPME